MRTHKLIVFTNANPGQEDEFNRWYDDVHLPDIVALPGFVSAQRFRLSDHQMPGRPASEHRYLAIYDIEEGRVGEALEQLKAARGSLVISEALNANDGRPYVFDPLGEPLSSSDMTSASGKA